MEYKALKFEAKAEDGNTFTGFASTPDLDQGGDVVAKGAFSRTIAQRGGKIKMLWNHKSDTLPVGKYTVVEEREGGLYVEGKISDTSAGRDVMTLLRDGAIDSMSIGFIPKDADYNEDGVRVIKDLDLLEVSLVNFPMNEMAVITSVKSLEPREIERVLREAGLSKSQACAIATAGVKRLREADQKAMQDAEALEALYASINEFKQNARNN